MAAGSLVRRVSVTPPDRFDDPGVLLDRRLRAVRQRHERRTEKTQVADPRKALLQIAVVRAAMDRGVKSLVVSGKQLSLTLYLALPLHQVDEVLYLHVGSVPRAQPGRGAFQRLAHDVELHHRLAVEARHDQPVARLVLEHAFRFETPDGVTHRRAADLQPFGHLDFHHAVAGLELALLDGVAQPAINVLAARAMARRVRFAAAVELSGHSAWVGVSSFGLTVPNSECILVYTREFLVSSP